MLLEIQPHYRAHGKVAQGQRLDFHRAKPVDQASCAPGILGRKPVELMFMNHLHDQGGLPLLNEPWVSKTENRSGELQLGLGYGYGGYVIMDVAQNAVPGSAGTYGWGGNSSTYFFIDPAEDLVAVFLTQLTPSSSYPLRAQFRSLVYQALTD